LTIHKCLLGLSGRVNVGKDIDSYARTVLLINNQRGGGARRYSTVIELQSENGPIKIAAKSTYGFDEPPKMKSPFGEDKYKETRIIAPFPLQQGAWPRASYNVPLTYIKHVEHWKPLSTRLIKPIDHFDCEKMPSILEYLKEEDTLTFVIDDSKCAIDFLEHLVPMSQRFKYRNYRGYTAHEHWSNRKERNKKEHLMMLLKFYNISQVIPIYDHRNVSGMAVQVSLAYQNDITASSAFKPLIEMYAVLSDYSENLLVVDGNIICNSSNIDKGVVQELAITCKDNAKVCPIESWKPYEKIKELPLPKPATQNQKSKNTTSAFDDCTKWDVTYTK